MGAASAWRDALVQGSDIDSDAVLVSNENAHLNGFGQRLRFIKANGLSHPTLASNGPYDLVIANILANPLRKLAIDIHRAAAARGRIILSGLREEQQTKVFEAYRRHGYRFENRRIIDGWATLTLRRGVHCVTSK